MDLNTVEAIISPPGREALRGFRPGDAYLAGGSALFSEPGPQLRRLFDLDAFGWPALVAGEDGLEIGATCTLAELSRITVPERWPALAIVLRCCQALRGSFKVWNVATVGGNLCTALPAGPMTSLTVALDGVCSLWAPDGSERAIGVDELVIGDANTSLEPGELLRSVWLPATALRARAVMRQRSLTPLGRSAALLIARLDDPADGGAFHLTVTAATPRPVRLEFADGLPDAEELADALDARLGPSDYFDDVHGTPRWRRHLTTLLAEQLRAELADGLPQ
jgi:CO/xanthine dehydrogenase FAD-binding subunit